MLLVVGAALLFLSSNHILGGLRDAALTRSWSWSRSALILAPFLWRLGRNLAAERAERIRSQERAELAAHLHDSVLQTLTLMQKRADDPREVAALARRQERELRDWLAGDGAAPARRASPRRCAAAAEEVEDDHRVAVEVVVGRRLRARRARRGGARRRRARGAAERRQARRRAGPDPRLRRGRRRPRSRSSSATAGPGFELAAVPADRRGVRESIVGQDGADGGRAEVRSMPGGGTEVALAIGAPSREEGEPDERRLPSVVIVDDHELFRAGVRAELEGLVDVRGEAGDVEEAVAAILREKPDVVLLDVHMPGGGGVEVIRQVARERPAQRFLALSVSDAAEDVIAVIRAGARGYVTKSISGRGARGRDRAGSATATPSSRPAWPASCSTPSTARSRRPRSTPSSTSSRCASARCCA